MSRFFDPFILLIVLLNCILLALIDPTKPDDEQKNYIKIGEIVFSVIYIIEMLLKVSILGVNGYFRYEYNCACVRRKLKPIKNCNTQVVYVHRTEVSEYIHLLFTASTDFTGIAGTGWILS